MLKRAIVVGASSGIGAALARVLCQEGFVVAAVARRQEKLQALADGINAGGATRCHVFAHDVTDTAGARRTFDDAVRALDGLDVIVYAAGVMPTITPDTYDAQIDRTIFEVNVIGASNWLNLAAERFAVQQSGTIVGIGSVAGDRGRLGNPAYCASKAALHTYLEALRNRLAPVGGTVVTIKPGPVRTAMTEGREFNGLTGALLIDADEAAMQIYSAIRRGSTVAYVPKTYMPIMTGIKSVPSVVFRRMKLA